MSSNNEKEELIKQTRKLNLASEADRAIRALIDERPIVEGNRLLKNILAKAEHESTQPGGPTKVSDQMIKEIGRLIKTAEKPNIAEKQTLLERHNNHFEVANEHQQHLVTDKDELLLGVASD